MKYFVRTVAAFSIYFIGILFVRAENNQFDSLIRLLPAASQIEQVKIYYSVGSELDASNPDSAMGYFRDGLQLARELGNDTLGAKCLRRIGMIHYNAGDYNKAITNLYEALKIFERYQDKGRTLRCMQYLGMAYNEQGMYDKALDFAKQALVIARSIGDSASTAVSLTQMGSVYYSQNDYDKALVVFQQALQRMEELKDRQGISDGLNNVALMYDEQKNYIKALEYHTRSLAMSKENEDSRGTAASYHNIGRLYFNMKKYPLAISYLDSSIALAKNGNDQAYLRDAYNTLSEVYSSTGEFEKAYRTHLLFSNLNDTLLSEENKRQFAEMNTRYETEKKDHQISQLNRDKNTQKIIRNGFMGGFAVVLFFAGLVFTQRNKIKKGKKRSDELLLNILPSEVAEELKLKGSAEAKQFNDVTVMFTDFKNFTQISEKLSPAELVAEIHFCFKAFDAIIGRHNIEKIKTIGDSYMCAGGLPVSNETNAHDVIAAALEIQKFMQQHVEYRRSHGNEPFEIRIGVHTGPVVAGIVGVKKFAYDIWGDTVNIASRMETSGEAGKVNISGATYELVKDKFKCTYRGKVQAKNKGEIDMYFVES